MKCWCKKPVHAGLIYGCVGDAFLRAMFQPPSVNQMLYSAMTMYGDILALALEGDEKAKAMIAEMQPPKPTVEMDRAILKAAGMVVTDDEVLSLRSYYGSTEEWYKEFWK